MTKVLRFTFQDESYVQLVVDSNMTDETFAKALNIRSDWFHGVEYFDVSPMFINMNLCKHIELLTLNEGD